MDAVTDLLKWAVSHGVQLNGIRPEHVPGRGIGIIATRRLKAGKVILEVPTHLLRSITSVPKPVSRKLPRDISVHGLLAADLCLDTSAIFAKWKAVFPSSADLASSMPFLWDARLQDLLPFPGKKLLAKQQAKFAKDWDVVSTAFPSISRRAYLEAWLLVNSRTFYFVTPRTEKLHRDDRMVLQPIADLFNHAAQGCAVSFDSASFSFTTDRDYAAGEEIFISYGRHSNDFLLVEYGFTLADNKWDEACLDDLLLPRMKSAHRALLEEAGFRGNYVLDGETVCHRTQVALRTECMTVSEWRRFVEGFDDGEASQGKVDELLGDLLMQYNEQLQGILDEIDRLEAGEESQRKALRRRWEQIRVLVSSALERLDG